MNKVLIRKNAKGITLIALVITIIVLLILAGVSIAMLTGQNGILTQAQNAKTTNENKSAEEKVKLAIMAARSQSETGELDADKLIAEITNNYGGTASKTNDGFPVNATIDGKSFTVDGDGNIEGNGSTGTKQDRTGLKVGDYINYKPDTEDGKTYSLQSTQSGYSPQTITKETLNWRILKINGDGSIDIISDPTSNIVYFQGALGYNNGVYLLNDICKELYSNTTKGVTARSVNLKDMEDWLTDAGRTARNEYTNSSSNVKYGETKTYTDTKSYTPDAYNSEEDENSNHYTSPTTNTYTKLGTLNAKQTYYYIPINETNYGEGAKVLSNSNYYWVAARDITCYSNYAYFGLRYAYTGIGSFGMFSSVADDYNNFIICVRAVVSLGSSVQINANKGDSPANAHTIEW